MERYKIIPRTPIYKCNSCERKFDGKDALEDVEKHVTMPTDEPLPVGLVLKDKEGASSFYIERNFDTLDKYDHGIIQRLVFSINSRDKRDENKSSVVIKQGIESGRYGFLSKRDFNWIKCQNMERFEKNNRLPEIASSDLNLRNVIPCYDSTDGHSIFRKMPLTEEARLDNAYEHMEFKAKHCSDLFVRRFESFDRYLSACPDDMFDEGQVSELKKLAFISHVHRTLNYNLENTVHKFSYKGLIRDLRRVSEKVGIDKREFGDIVRGHLDTVI